MSSRTAAAPNLPEDLATAVEGGVLTNPQIVRLITFEATTLGLDYNEALRRARQDALPRTPVGTELRYLVGLLDG